MHFPTLYGIFETLLDAYTPIHYNEIGDVMFENVENLKLMDIISDNSSLHLIRNQRADHGFIFKMSGESRYDFDHQSIDLREGDMLYIPKGSNYTVRRTSSGESKFVSICFDGVIKDAQPRLYHAKNFADIHHICHTLERLWLLRSPSDEYKCVSIFYDILSQICEMDEMTYRSSHQYQLIEPALEYLKLHLFDCNLKTQTLSDLCKISGTYFRKIFQSQFGISPQKYIIHQRLEQAKSIIDQGEFHSLAEVALSVGYEDPLYFSKAFKEKYGVSPSRL